MFHKQNSKLFAKAARTSLQFQDFFGGRNNVTSRQTKHIN